MSKTQPTVELGARSGVSKAMPEEEELGFTTSPLNPKHQQMGNTESGFETIWKE